MSIQKGTNELLRSMKMRKGEKKNTDNKVERMLI